jgi:hypothetical protein
MWSRRVDGGSALWVFSKLVTGCDRKHPATQYQNAPLVRYFRFVLHAIRWLLLRQPTGHHVVPLDLTFKARP